MLVRHVSSMLCSFWLCLALVSCSSQGKHMASHPADAGNSSGVPTVIPVNGIPKKIHRRYVNYAGAEAYSYTYQDRTFVLTRWNGTGPFQIVPFASATDPVVLPLPNGQTIVASRDQILLRHGCPDFACAFNEVIKAPTNDPPAGLDAMPISDGSDPREVLMVNGTGSIYTLDLLERAWRMSDALPNGTHAVAIKSTADAIFVLDQLGKQVLTKGISEKAWRSVPVPTAMDETIEGITILNGYLILSSGSKLKAASLQQLHNLQASGLDNTPIKWNEIAPPDSNSILQVSADGSKLYCTTVLGDTYQLDGGALGSSAGSGGWSLFTPSGNVPVGSEQIQNAAVVDGELLAFTSGGVAHSTNDGVAWTRETADEDKLRRLDEVEYRTTRYAITADALLKKDGSNGTWQRVRPSTGACSNSSFGDNGVLRGDRLLKIDDRKLLLVYTLISTGSDVGCIFDIQDASIEPLSKNWQRSTAPMDFVAIHGNLLAATQAGIWLWLPSEHRWADPTEASSSHNAAAPKNITAAAPYGSNSVIVATSTGTFYRADFSKNRLDDWEAVPDNQQLLVKNLPANNGKIVAIWVNPDRLSEIYALVNQNGASVLYSRDKTDSFFLFADQKPDAPVGFVEADGTLLTVGASQFNRVVSNRPLPGSLGDYAQRFGEKIQSWVKEPVSWITAFFGTYLTAVVCILALRYLPPNPILGRNWLASFVVKPFTMIPLTGRWILFLGYRRRVFRMLKRDTPYFGLPADMPSGEIVMADGEGTKLLDAILKHLSASKQMVLTGRPGSGKSMLLERIALKLSEPGFKERKWLPVLITSDDYNGDLIESASTVLRERFGIPLDKEDVLLAQMQVGGLLFLLDGLSEISTSRTAAVVDLQRVTKMPEFVKCAVLVATRPFKGGPGFPECKVLPVSGQDAVDEYLPLFNLKDGKAVRAKENLLGFGNDPIDVQLLAMTIEASDATVTQRRHEIFVSFFRKRLGAEGDDSNDRWDGWCVALELIAKAFCVDTGVRSIGLSPRLLIGSIEEANPAFGNGTDDRSLLNELRDTYGVDYTNGSALLDYLKSVGLLVRVERWKFAHDTYEEFFCASFLVRKTKVEGHLPELVYWRNRPQEFKEVFDFVHEMVDEGTAALIAQENLPTAWQATPLPPTQAPTTGG
jgi:NACHT domain